MRPGCPHLRAIDSDILYYALMGAAPLPYVNAPEVRLLTGRDPKNPKWIAAHADALVSILLPGLAVLELQLADQPTVG